MTVHKVNFRTKSHAPHDPDSSVGYHHKKDHRDKTPGKAQWEIPEADERSIFADAMENCWTEERFAWSLHRPGGKTAHLGVDRDHKTRLFIARFDEHITNEWHGYPCNHKKPQQRPTESILSDWLRRKLLPSAKIRKIVSGQRCEI